jgi:hypothetical protein
MTLFRTERGKHLVMTWAGVLALGATLGLGCYVDPGVGEKPSYGVGAGTGATTGGATTGAGGSSSNGATTGAGNGTQAGTGGTIIPQEATYEVTVDSASVELMSEVQVTVTIAPNEFIGPVSLSAAGLGAGITAELAPPSVDLDGTTPVSVTLTLSTLSSVAPGDFSFVVVGTSAPGEQSGAGTLTVQPVITLVIPQGVNELGGTINNPYMTAYGPYPIAITAPADISEQNPVTVKFRNEDGVSHEIHADEEPSGFPHSPGPIAPNGMDQPREVNSKGIYNFYLHDQGAVLTPGRIVIE